MPAIMMADPGSLANMRQFGDQPPPPQFQGFQPGPGQSPGEAPEVAKMRRLQDMENLRNMLIAWNANRLDLFELSMPNEVGRNFPLIRMIQFMLAAHIDDSNDIISNIVFVNQIHVK